jgi:hypothetical protein
MRCIIFLLANYDKYCVFCACADSFNFFNSYLNEKSLLKEIDILEHLTITEKEIFPN